MEKAPDGFLLASNRSKHFYDLFGWYQFNNLNASLVQSFSTFKKFYVKNNYIDFFFARGLQKLEQLDLTGNNIFEIPRFCDDQTGQSLVPRLKNLILTDNVIRSLQQSSFRCLYSLSVLILDGNRMKTLGNNIFSELVNLNRLSINEIPKLKELSPLAFNISSLHTLQFVQNGFKFDTANCSADIFKYLPNLRTLDLTKNHLPNDQYTLYAMFANLAELEKLILQSTHVSILPNGLFQKMTRLNFLSLAGNYIEKWEQSIFENITSLRKLYLSGNYIHIINKTSLPYSLLMSLEVFDLSNNKFWCTCAQKWFVDFLRSSNITKSVLVNWPDRYTCSYPDDWNLLSLQDYNPTDAVCKEWTPLFTVVIIVSSASFLVFLVILVIFRCHANIRNVVYLLRVYNHKRKGYVRLSSSEDYQFDAFIVYCDADREWVHNVLLQRLEAIGLKVCIHHRDFDVGEPITNNIERYIEISWKIIVVMSNNFTKSEWCQWEIDLVQERRRKHGKDALVLIMYSPIDTHHMTSSIRTMLDTTPHLAYKEGFGEDLFWSATVKAVDRPLTDPPTAMF